MMPVSLLLVRGEGGGLGGGARLSCLPLDPPLIR